MPPKPGRSKACITCLKRKKGCDQQRPSCGQCRKACIACGGYDKGFQFVNSSSEITTSTQKRTAAAVRRSPNRLPAEPPARSAYEVACMALFWKSYLPNGKALPAKVAHTTVGGWIDVLQVLGPSDGILRKGLLAISLSTIGRRDDNKWMRDEGLKFYCSALEDMSTALREPKQWKCHDGSLAVIRVFSLYEALYGGSDRENRPAQAHSWTWHNSGEIAFIKDLTPSYFISGRAHRLFVDGRLHLTITALWLRKEIFLSEPEWKTIPWSRQPKTSRDMLLDVLVDIPSIYENMDIMASREESDEKENSRRSLTEECLALDKTLSEWNDEYGTESSTSLLSAEGFPADKICSLFGMILYWSTCVLVNAMLHDLAGIEKIARGHSDSNTCSRNIIMAVSQLFHPGVGIFRVHLVTFPLGVALRHLVTAGPGEMVAEKVMFVECLKKPECSTIYRFLSALEPAHLKRLFGERSLDSHSE